MSILQYDDEATKKLLAVYTTPDVVSQRRKFLEYLKPVHGERILDVGAGPGFLLSEIAKAVGESGFACGTDISVPLLEVARSHCVGTPWVELKQADATQLPYPDESFDAAVSTQVLEYVPDVDAAIAELARVTRSGGRLAILDTDWDSMVWHSTRPDLMKLVMTAWRAHAPHPGLPRTLARRLRQAGLQVTEQLVLPLFNPDYGEETYSNRMVDLISSYVSNRDKTGPDTAFEWATDIQNSGLNGDYFFSLNRYLFLAFKP